MNFSRMKPHEIIQMVKNLQQEAVCWSESREVLESQIDELHGILLLCEYWRREKVRNIKDGDNTRELLMARKKAHAALEDYFREG